MQRSYTTMTTDDEIFKQLLELTQNEEQVRYLTRTNDKIKDGKIDALQRDLGSVQRQLSDVQIQKHAAQEFSMKIVDRLISGATRYDFDN